MSTKKFIVTACFLLFCMQGKMSNGEETSESKGISTAIIPKAKVSALLGHPINISCHARDNRPLQSCRWERLPPINDQRYFVHFNKGEEEAANEVRETFNCNCTYKYVGKGLQQGDCSISIVNVTDFQISKWQCLLTDVNERDTWFGNIEILALDPIGKPYFKNPDVLEELVYNDTNPSTTNVTCCVDGGDPNVPLSINIYLANYTHGPVAPYRKDEGNRLFLRGQQACRQVQYTFLREDNGRSLVCNATYVFQSQNYELIDSVPLQVKYAPKFQTKNVSQELSSNKDRLVLRMALMSNPEPNVCWFLVTDEEHDVSFEIKPDHVKYRQEVFHLERDQFIANLIILDFDEKDYDRIFKLVVANSFGNVGTEVKIVSPPPGQVMEFYWIMIFIGIGAFILFALIALVIYIVLRNAKNRFSSKVYTVAPTKDSAKADVDTEKNQTEEEATELQESSF